MIALRADAELKLTFERLIGMMEVPVEWNGLFLAVGNYLILQGSVRSLFFNFDTKKVVTNVMDIPIEEKDVVLIREHPQIKDVLNMILYAFGKWGTVKGLNVERDERQLNRLFSQILGDFQIESQYDREHFRFYKNKIRITYEDVIEEALKEDEEELLPEEEEESGGLWHKIVWKRAACTFVRKETTLAERRKKRIGNNFYVVGCLCPKCGEKMFLAVYPETEEFEIETEEGGVRMARVYTCKNCCTVYTPRPGRLLSDGDVYRMDFERDRVAYADYLELLGRTAGKYVNTNYNEYADGRRADTEEEPKTEEERIGEIIDRLPDMTEEELADTLCEMEEGYFSDRGVVRLERAIHRFRAGEAVGGEEETRGEAFGGEEDFRTVEEEFPEDGEDSRGEEDFPEKEEELRENKEDFPAKREKNHASAEYSRAEMEKKDGANEPIRDGSGFFKETERAASRRRENAGKESPTAPEKRKSAAPQKERRKETGRPLVKEPEAVETPQPEPETHEKARNSGEAPLKSGAPKSRPQSKVTAELMAEPMAKAMAEPRAKAMAEPRAKAMAEPTAKATAEPTAKATTEASAKDAEPVRAKTGYLRQPSAKPDRTAGGAAAGNIRGVEEQSTGQRPGVNAHDANIHNAKERNDKKRRDKKRRDEKESLARVRRLVRKPGVKTRKQLIEIKEQLQSEKLDAELLAPYLDEVEEKIRAIDEKKLRNLCGDVGAMDFEEAKETLERITQEDFLPDLKYDAVKEIEKRMQKIKTDECELLVYKFQSELEEAGIAESDRMHFYPAKKVLLRQCEPEETRVIDYALASYAAGIGKFEYPVFVMDKSWDKTGKEGFILTPEHIFYSTWMTSYNIPLLSIDTIGASTGLLNRGVFVYQTNGTKTKLPVAAEPSEYEALANVLDGFVRYLQEKPFSRKEAYLAKERHETICCYRCGYIYKGGGVCPRCGYKGNG